MILLKKIIHFLFLILVAVFVVLLLLTYLSPYINPLFNWYFAILSLLYPFILLVNLVLLGISFFFQKKYLRYVLLIVILGGYLYHHRFFALHFTNKKDIKTGDIRILSYNVKTFDLYNWSKNYRSRQKIIHFIDSVQPDIACFQEYITDNRNIINTTDTLSGLLHTNFIHQYFLRSNRYFHFGMATFSKYPIVHRDEILFKNSQNFVLITDILKNKDTIRVFNCHLQSNRFDQHEFNYLDSISDNFDKKKFHELKPILKRLRLAFHKRAHQIVILKNSMNRSPYPIILCGDFNDVPNSYTYQTLSKNLYDSFLESGNGFGTTYSKFLMPYRIDFVLYDNHFTSVYSKVYEIPYSDHFPYFTVLRQ